jgi:hypothetical protein
VSRFCKPHPLHLLDPVKEWLHGTILVAVILPVQQQGRHINLVNSINDRPVFCGAGAFERVGPIPIESSQSVSQDSLRFRGQGAGKLHSEVHSRVFL